ncbi:MAG: hypothetical protein HOI95_29725 [Chromatiales bacterium]|mgnify:FL=1|nr:hypothetical protein [Chromatiales bacterium]
MSSEAPWTRNFRDLSASVTRMATLATSGNISSDVVAEEIERLRNTWHGVDPLSLRTTQLATMQELDRFDSVQLADVIRVCRANPSLSAAGRDLFAVSQAGKSTPNDADRLRKYLARFDFNWQTVRGH